MENLAGYALEVNIGGGDALEANIGGGDALEANIGGVSMLRGADGKSAYQYAVEGGYTGTEEEFAAKLAAEMSDGELRVTNPNDSSHELHAGNQWAIFVRDSRLRAISITPVFSDGSSNQTFSWQLCETSDGSDVDYNSTALTILKSGTANCGDTLTFDSFTSRNALCILTTDPVKMRYCPPSTAVNGNIRVGLRRNMAVMSTDYGCLSGTFILTIDDEPFMLKSAFTDKTISFYGDSLTQAVPSQYSKGYRSWIVELCGFASQTNRGVSGYRLWQILDAIRETTETADCISVMGGYNDGNQWDSARLGSLGDTTALESNEDATGTIYGTVYQICAVLKAKYPTTFLMFITPPAEKNPVSGKVSLAEIRKAIIETAELFSIPVYDNYKLSGVDVTNLNIYTSDGAHWTDATHEMIGKNIAKWMLATVGKTREISGASAGTGTEVVARKERVSQFENDAGYITPDQLSDVVSVADIVDNLTTNVANKPLSAAQGVALKALIDAITVPDKLPNPNALTFTGAVTGSYDGSAPLSVNIPQGGGGGASVEKQWRLLNTVTLTEPVSAIDILTDSDGNPFEISEFAVYAPLGVVASANSQLLIGAIEPGAEFDETNQTYYWKSISTTANGFIGTNSKSILIKSDWVGGRYTVCTSGTYDVASAALSVGTVRFCRDNMKDIGGVRLFTQYPSVKINDGTFYLYGR